MYLAVSENWPRARSHPGAQVVKAGVQAGKLVGRLAKLCGGGSGKPALAQAGGKDATARPGSIGPSNGDAT